MTFDQLQRCRGVVQKYCDNSQKLFRTSPSSAVALAGYAFGRAQAPSPLDLEVAPVLLRIFGDSGLPIIDNEVSVIPELLWTALSDALTGVASLYDPRTSPEQLSVIVLFARFDENRIPVLQKVSIRESWVTMGPKGALAPRYDLAPMPATIAREFRYLTAGINEVAESILQGRYQSTDAVIQHYYERLRDNTREDMPVAEMTELAHAILRETKRSSNFVGGDDQIGEFPSAGTVNFYVAPDIPKFTGTVSRLMRWEGPSCSGEHTPPCGNPPLSFSVSRAQRPGPVHFIKFLLASNFENVAVILDSNLFIADAFENVTLKWNGDPFTMYRNSFKNCVLELAPGAPEPPYAELRSCRLERKARLEVPPDTIGLPIETFNGPNGSFGLPRGLRP